MKDFIYVRGARQHNLKGFDLRIPRRSFVVITGPSGSGKSSLAFDTIYAEGQRRYVESLSSYARQFLERMEKPDVDGVDGLSPAVAIQQSNPTRTSRSTVGTATEVYDYLRLLWARIGHAHCPKCGRRIVQHTVQSVTDALLRYPVDTRIAITFPLPANRRGATGNPATWLRASGFMRVIQNGTHLHLDDLEAPLTGMGAAVAAAKGAVGDSDAPSEMRAAELLVVTDRIAARAEDAGRIAEGVALAFREGGGYCVVEVAEKNESAAAGGVVYVRYTEHAECPWDGGRAPERVPQLFSFNSPRGACDRCTGFGANLEYDESLIIPDPELSLQDGAIDPWNKPRYGKKRTALLAAARARGTPVDTAWKKLADDDRDFLLHGKSRGYNGIFPFLRELEEKRYKQYIRIFLRQYQTAQQCADCRGSRLRSEALLVRVGGRTIADATALSVVDLRDWLSTLELTASEIEISRHILREAQNRVNFLCDVGLEYMTLDRATRTLSGGEAQRIALANSIGSQLVDTLYVLDEPSIGLHPRDLDRLLAILARLRDGGNTVLVVEHDLDAIRAADYMIELGPGSGELGGSIVFEGPVAHAQASPLTGQYLTGQRNIPVPETRRELRGATLEIAGARENNLQDVNVSIPIGALTVVTGVSGSGKSTLVHDVLYRALEQRLHGGHSARRHLGERVGVVASITGWEVLSDVVLVDQSPIGRSARSNPITYVKAFEEIRRIFANTALARQRKYAAGKFSFNVKGGRCDTCDGAGHLQVEMVFMADVLVPCEVCAGRRFKDAVLEVTVNGKNIHEVLQLTVDQTMRFFPKEEKLGQALWQMHLVGLGYLRLGQPATTLSGGEAQRLKIARELAQKSAGRDHKLYILDEPTTGLHNDEVKLLARVLDRLVERGNTVLVIEHNLELIKLADWIIDLGPEGGDGGGTVVAAGRPEEVAGVDASHTGRFLRSVLPRWKEAAGSKRAGRGAAGRGSISVRNGDFS